MRQIKFHYKGNCPHCNRTIQYSFIQVSGDGFVNNTKDMHVHETWYAECRSCKDKYLANKAFETPNILDEDYPSKYQVKLDLTHFEEVPEHSPRIREDKILYSGRCEECSQYAETTLPKEKLYVYVDKMCTNCRSQMRMYQTKNGIFDDIQSILLEEYQ